MIDTNILMAALLNRTGAPAKIMERFRNAEFELATSESIVREYRGVRIVTVGQFLTVLEEQERRHRT